LTASETRGAVRSAFGLGVGWGDAVGVGDAVAVAVGVGAGAPIVQSTAPERSAWKSSLSSSAQYTGLRSPAHSASGASAKPSLLRFAMPAGRSNVLVTAKCPDGSMPNVLSWPPQLLSQTTHRCVLSGSYSRPMTCGKPLVIVATRVKDPFV